jgi:TPR repeat protein
VVSEVSEPGVPPAQNNLGGMYLRGLGVEQSDVEALRWYLRAAGDGYLVGLLMQDAL